MLDAASTTSTLVDRVKRLTVDSAQPRAIEDLESTELEGSGGGESRGSEDSRLRTYAREPNAETLSAQREERSGEGEGGEPNIGHYIMDGYQLSIVFVFTCMSFERAGAEVEGF